MSAIIPSISRSTSTWVPCSYRGQNGGPLAASDHKEWFPAGLPEDQALHLVDYFHIIGGK